MTGFQCQVEDEQAMVKLGEKLGKALDDRALIFLEGELGAGKTTLCRGVLRAMGHVGAVKSPTFTLVEPYKFNDKNVYHFDLYRLGDAEELEYMGIRDYFQPGNYCLVEWPIRGQEYLPQPDLIVQITFTDDGRKVALDSENERGETILDKIKASD